jgi:16S rRNA (adenine1518-N6/adenine1519-N6)-dimethyltransferase
MRAKRSLSQNFLVDKNLRRKIVAELEASGQDRVLEVGPGNGELSELLVGQVSSLVLIEKDDRLAPVLARRWEDRPDVSVINGDALEVDISTLPGAPFTKIISNVPYSITSPLIFTFLDIQPLPDRIVILVQAEVAQRLVAEPGGKEYGALTIGVQTRAHVRMAFRVGRKAFRPIPGVDSALVVIEPFPGVRRVDVDAVRQLARAAFSRRRKQLGTILRTAPEYRMATRDIELITSEFGIDPRTRPEAIPPDIFASLAIALAARSSHGTG